MLSRYRKALRRPRVLRAPERSMSQCWSSWATWAGSACGWWFWPPAPKGSPTTSQSVFLDIGFAPR